MISAPLSRQNCVSHCSSLKNKLYRALPTSPNAPQGGAFGEHVLTAVSVDGAAPTPLSAEDGFGNCAFKVTLAQGDTVILRCHLLLLTAITSGFTQ
jgi:hypothetical protein